MTDITEDQQAMYDRKIAKGLSPEDAARAAGITVPAAAPAEPPATPECERAKTVNAHKETATVNTLRSIIANEPLRTRVYGALVALLPLLAAFGVPLTDPQSAGILGFAYAVLIGGTEWARAKVTPVQ